MEYHYIQEYSPALVGTSMYFTKCIHTFITTVMHKIDFIYVISHDITDHSGIRFTGQVPGGH